MIYSLHVPPYFFVYPTIKKYGSPHIQLFLLKNDIIHRKYPTIVAIKSIKIRQLSNYTQLASHESSTWPRKNHTNKLPRCSQLKMQNFFEATRRKNVPQKAMFHGHLGYFMKNLHWNLPWKTLLHPCFTQYEPRLTSIENPYLVYLHLQVHRLTPKRRLAKKDGQCHVWTPPGREGLNSSMGINQDPKKWSPGATLVPYF